MTPHKPLSEVLSEMNLLELNALLHNLSEVSKMISFHLQGNTTVERWIECEDYYEIDSMSNLVFLALKAKTSEINKDKVAD